MSIPATFGDLDDDLNLDNLELPSLSMNKK